MTGNQWVKNYPISGFFIVLLNSIFVMVGILFQKLKKGVK